MPFTSPYINTKLYSLIPLKADQMDNKIYLNLKQNLEKKLFSSQDNPILLRHWIACSNLAGKLSGNHLFMKSINYKILHYSAQRNNTQLYLEKSSNIWKTGYYFSYFYFMC